MARLEEIADQLESGELPLEAAIERYEEGVTCYKQCHKILTGAEKKVEILTRTDEGELVTKPFDEETEPAQEARNKEASGSDGPSEDEEDDGSLF